MRRFLFAMFFGCTALGIAGTSLSATVTVDPNAAWLGWMNVLELPSNGGAYLWGTAWGKPDLVATFAGPVLTLKPNSITDPNSYWYTPWGGPGATGNKIMEANMYVETTGTLNGQSLTFTGTVLSNTLTSSHESVAFIKDFAPDYSSFNIATVPLPAGAFSVTLNTDADPARHVQYGFQTSGANVWITDVEPYGFVEVTAISELVAGDYNQNGVVDAADYVVWRNSVGQSGAGLAADGNGDNVVDANDFSFWRARFGNTAGSGSIAAAAVPEASTIGLLLGTLAVADSFRRRG